jgi:hypothetical protein
MYVLGTTGGGARWSVQLEIAANLRVLAVKQECEVGARFCNRYQFVQLSIDK